MGKIILILMVMISVSALADADCDKSKAVSVFDPDNIAKANKKIELLKGLMAKESEILKKEIEPQIAAWQHTIGVYDQNSQSAETAQLAVAEAINYMNEAIIFKREVKLTFDRLAKTVHLTSDRPLSQQFKDVIPTLRLHESTRSVLEQWVKAIALLETRESKWQAAEKDIVSQVSDSKISLSEILVERLRELSGQLESDLLALKNSRAQDQQTVSNLKEAALSIQWKIAGYFYEVAQLEKAIQYWQNELKQWTPKEIFCPFRIAPRKPFV